MQQTMERIQADDEKAWAIKAEKAKLLEMRQQVRREADLEKQIIMEKFEKIKRKGNLDEEQLTKELGLSPQQSPFNQNSREHSFDKKEVK